MDLLYNIIEEILRSEVEFKRRGTALMRCGHTLIADWSYVLVMQL